MKTRERMFNGAEIRWKRMAGLAMAVACCLLFLVGCEGIMYPNTPQGVVKKFVDGFNERDLDKLLSTLPTEKEVKYIGSVEEVEEKVAELRTNWARTLRMVKEEAPEANMKVTDEVRYKNQDNEYFRGKGIVAAEVCVVMTGPRNGKDSEIKSSKGWWTCMKIKGRWVCMP